MPELYKKCQYYHAGYCLKEDAKCSVEETGVCTVWLELEYQWTECGYIKSDDLQNDE